MFMIVFPLVLTDNLKCIINIIIKIVCLSTTLTHHSESLTHKMHSGRSVVILQAIESSWHFQTCND